MWTAEPRQVLGVGWRVKMLGMRGWERNTVNCVTGKGRF